MYENLLKAVASLKDYLRNQFFRATHDCSLTDNTNFLSFEDWLEKRVKDQFNPLAETLALQEAKLNQNQKAYSALNRVQKIECIPTSSAKIPSKAIMTKQKSHQNLKITKKN